VWGQTLWWRSPHLMHPCQSGFLNLQKKYYTTQNLHISEENPQLHTRRIGVGRLVGGRPRTHPKSGFSELKKNLYHPKPGHFGGIPKKPAINKVGARRFPNKDVWGQTLWWRSQHLCTLALRAQCGFPKLINRIFGREPKSVFPDDKWTERAHLCFRSGYSLAPHTWHQK
jgi:hypothetical protein